MSNPSLLELLSTLTKFDLKLTFDDDQKPNFDPTIRIGSNQSHLEEYWIPFWMTTHRLTY